jgi:hypothetical protein
MALGTRYPYGKRSDSGAPMNEDRFGRSGQSGAQTLKALHLEALLVVGHWGVAHPRAGLATHRARKKRLDLY